MKKFLLSLFVAMVATVGAQAQNLLKNADMETWADALPSMWDKMVQKTTNVTVKEVAAGHAGKAVEIPLARYKGELSNARLCQKVELKAGTYVLSFWAKGAVEGKHAVAGHMHIDENNKNKYEYSKEKVSLSTTEWKQVTYEFSVDKDSPIWVVLRNDRGADGSIFVDDASLTLKGTTAVQTLSTNAATTTAFDLSGRRVSPSQKGIVVVNGVKRMNR